VHARSLSHVHTLSLTLSLYDVFVDAPHSVSPSSWRSYRPPPYVPTLSPSYTHSLTFTHSLILPTPVTGRSVSSRVCSRSRPHIHTHMHVCRRFLATLLGVLAWLTLTRKNRKRSLAHSIVHSLVLPLFHSRSPTSVVCSGAIVPESIYLSAYRSLHCGSSSLVRALTRVRAIALSLSISHPCICIRYTSVLRALPLPLIRSYVRTLPCPLSLSRPFVCRRYTTVLCAFVHSLLSHTQRTLTSMDAQSSARIRLLKRSVSYTYKMNINTLWNIQYVRLILC
jgi:hypothetical protein